MKNNLIILFSLVVISVISFTSCEPFIENKITARNFAAGDVFLNLRGQEYYIPSGETLVLSDFKKGSFNYSTIYSIPFGISTSTATGDVSGTMILNAGTEILLTYSSVVDSNKYTIFGVLTSSDDINRPDPFGDGQ